MALFRLYEEVRTEDLAIAWLQKKAILHNPRVCSNGHEMILSSDKQRRWRCRKSTCRCEVGLRKDTFLENSELPFKTFVLFVYLWSNERLSVKVCEEDLEMSAPSMVDWAM